VIQEAVNEYSLTGSSKLVDAKKLKEFSEFSMKRIEFLIAKETKN
jgi:hypothetical protein